VTALSEDLGSVPVTGGSDPLCDELDDILAARSIRTVFQPIVDLSAGGAVGVEVLSRGPEGSPLCDPATLFAAAARAGRLGELDLLCRYLGLSRAAVASPPAPAWVFVNVEPGHDADLSMSDELLGLLYTDLPFRIVVEFTERELTAQPAALLRFAEDIRRRGNIVALDDVGANPASLALLPLVRPEIVKLDMSLVHRPPTAASASIVGAVSAYAERTGAIVLAEGIETELHRRRAEAWGADWGQGYLFGHPGPMSAVGRRQHTHQLADVGMGGSPAAHPTFTDSLLQIACHYSRSRRMTRSTLAILTAQLESHALGLGESAVLLLRRPDAADLQPLDRQRYSRLAERTALVGVSAAGLREGELAGVHVGVAGRETQAGEWATVVMGPHAASTLVARPVAVDRPAAEDAGEAEYDVVISYQPDVAQEVARAVASELDVPGDPIGPNGG
jgi:EAL domain-containing protein (putative c-di-GMP-specific phosphodiesterase class I)